VNLAGTQITVVVPSGATTGLIGVAGKGGVGVSSSPFTVTAGPGAFFSPHFSLVPGLSSAGGGTATSQNSFAIGATSPPTATTSATSTTEDSTVQALDQFFADEPLFHPGIWVAGT
jgi:hypothetical protein